MPKIYKKKLLCIMLFKNTGNPIQQLTLLFFISIHLYFRLETTKLLLKHGADPFAKSRYGDDALQTACLKGAHVIFDYLQSRIEYSEARIADSHELIGKIKIKLYLRLHYII